MDYSPAQVSAFRYWIQGYARFYEPIVEAWFHACGYRTLAHPAVIGKRDIQSVISALFDGHRRLGPEVDPVALRQHLGQRQRLQPDFLLERDGLLHLAELKSWGGFRSGRFDLATLDSEFLRRPERSAFFVVDRVDGQPIAGKVLVVSARSEQHDDVLDTLQRAYNTRVDLLYLDELFRKPELADVIAQQLAYLQTAVDEIRQELGQI